MSGDFTPVIGIFCVGPLVTAVIFFMLGRWSKGIRIVRDKAGAPVVNDRRYTAADASQAPRGIRKLPGSPLPAQGERES